MKKWLLILLAVLTGVGIAVYQNADMRVYFNSKTDQRRPEHTSHNKLYKWHDQRGQTHFSDTPPEAGIRYTLVERQDKTNVLPAEAFTGKKKSQ